tara:strand:- start:682 stop:882 length:201 start_codon:yes stop_codon:yes gene_type:complete
MNLMKVGDLVKYETLPHEFAEYDTKLGVVVQLSRTGHTTLSAKVIFTNGQSEWFDTQVLEVVGEGG